MPYQPHRKDVDSRTLCRMIGPILETTTEVYVQWTCPKCGERSTSTDTAKLLLDEEGKKHVGIYEWYQHDEKASGEPCGYKVHANGYKFGYVSITVSLPNATGDRRRL